MTDRATEYASAVRDDEVMACQTVKQACDRFLKDLERTDFDYYYDEKYASNVCKFIEMLPTDNREQLKLLPFQSFIICNLFGWRAKSDKSMRYKTMLYSCARKSGKSFLIACISLVYLCLERGFSKQVLFTAGSLKQAHLAFDKAKAQLRNMQAVSPAILERYKITAEKILDTETDSFAVPLATNGNTGRLDGYGADMAVMDECGNIPSKVFEDTKKALESGMIQNPNAVLCMISTAGTTLNAFKEECEYARKVLSGKVHNERYFALIYELDNENEAFDEAKWEKANPILSSKEIGKTMQEKISNDLETARQQGDISNVVVKNFNLWKQATTNPYLTPEEWAETKRQHSYWPMRKKVFIGIDLSVRNDLTSISWAVPTKNRCWFVDSFSFVGGRDIEKKERTDGFNYRQAEERLECKIVRNESGIIDYDEVYEWLQDFIRKSGLDVQGIAYDPYNANSLVTKLEKSPWPVVPIRQGTKTLNVPTRDFCDKVRMHYVSHNDNKLLAYAANNAQVKIVNNGWLLNKSSKMSGFHIDPMAALINAWTIGMDYYNKKEKNESLNEYYSKGNFTF